MLPGLQPLFVEIPDRHREPRPEPRPILEGGGHLPTVPAAAAHWDFPAKVIFFFKKNEWIQTYIFPLCFCFWEIPGRSRPCSTY